MAEILLISGSYQIVKSISLFVSQNMWMMFVLRCSELWRTCPLNRVWRHMTRSGSVRSLNSGHTRGSGPRSMWHQQTRYMKWGWKKKPKRVNGYFESYNLLIAKFDYLLKNRIVKRRKKKKYDSFAGQILVRIYSDITKYIVISPCTKILIGKSQLIDTLIEVVIVHKGCEWWVMKLKWYNFQNNWIL